MKFGKVHIAFAGRFKEELKGIRNGKRYVHLFNSLQIKARPPPSNPLPRG